MKNKHPLIILDQIIIKFFFFDIENIENQQKIQRDKSNFKVFPGEYSESHRNYFASLSTSSSCFSYYTGLYALTYKKV